MSELLRESLEAVSAELVDSTSTAPVESTEHEAQNTASSSVQSETPATGAAEATSIGRDAQGRFAPKSTAGDSAGQAAPTGVPPTPEGAASSTPQPKPAETTQTEPPKPGEPDTTHAPASWKISERQAWANAPKEIRQAVHRRELETQQAISRHAPVRQFAESMQKALEPMREVIQRQGVAPERLVADYARFNQVLASGDVNAAAVAVTQIAKHYGIPVEALADAWEGKLGQPQRQQTREEIRAEVQAEERARWQAQQQKHELAGAYKGIAEFAKTVDPVLFNTDIHHDMADIIDAYARRSPPVEISLKEAHDRAVRMNPEAWAIVQQREQAKLAPTLQQATAKAQAASGSLKSRPASPVGGEARGSSIMDDLKAVVAATGGRT